MKGMAYKCQPYSLENICTCKECDHDYATDCMSCTCCEPVPHSMVMDGMEGFEPRGKSSSSNTSWLNRAVGRFEPTDWQQTENSNCLPMVGSRHKYP